MKDYRRFIFRCWATLIDGLGWLLLWWLPRPVVKPDQVERILILKFDRIGDSFLALPTIMALRELFPKAELVVACSPWNKGVLANHPVIDRLIVPDLVPDVHKSRWFNFLSWGLIKQLTQFVKEQQPTVVVDLQGSPTNVLAGWLARVTYRLGYRSRVLGFLLTQGASYNRHQPQADIYFSLARLLGYSKTKPYPYIQVSDEDQFVVDDLIKKHRLTNFIVVHLGAGRSYRQWPMNNFCQLVNLILDNYSDYQIVVIGGLEDQELASQLVVDQKFSQRLVVAIGQLKIAVSYGLIGRSVLFIGNDSGPGHLAAAQGVPTISFMNPWSGLRRWQARGPRVSLFHQSVHHCTGLRCSLSPCPNMAAISVEPVWATVQEWLDNN